jgi:DNA-binding protein H-NS
MSETEGRARRKPDLAQDGKAGEVPAKLQEMLEGLTVGELRAVIRFAEAQVREKAEDEKRALIEETQRRAEALGLSIRDLFGEVPQPAKRGRGRAKAEGTKAKVPVKYRGPGGEEWSGRGRAPKWVQVAEAEGKTRDDFAV